MTERIARTSERAADLDALFADNLTAARTRLGVTRRDLSKRSGISERTIEKIETGAGCWQNTRRWASIGEAVALSVALGVQPAELLKPKQVADV